MADSDFSKQEKHKFYREQEKRPNFRYFETELPEIENLLPASILQSWLLKDLKCKPTEIDKCFENAVGNEKLGLFFHEKFTRGNTKRKFTNPAEGGTLRSNLKKRLADFVYNGVMNKTITWTDLKESEILNRLVVSVNQFIHEKNFKKS